MADVEVDLHRKRSHVVALSPAGEVVLSRRIGNAPGEFLRIFGELEAQSIEVAFEATYGWSWFAELLAPAAGAVRRAAGRPCPVRPGSPPLRPWPAAGGTQAGAAGGNRGYRVRPLTHSLTQYPLASQIRQSSTWARRERPRSPPPWCCLWLSAGHR
jgi:hypothetical protein